MEDIVIAPVTLEILQSAIAGAFENPFFIILSVSIIGDIVTGWAKNKMYETGNSSAGIKGLMKHSVVLFVALVLSFCGMVSQTRYGLLLFDAFIIVLIGEYIKSMFENFGVMGFKYPAMLTAKVEQEIADKVAERDKARKLKEERKATE